MNFEEVSQALTTIATSMHEAQPTTQQASEAIIQATPAIEQAWREVFGNDAIWEQRAKHHGMLRTWWLRWQLRM
jgi:hypothetical protein